MVEIQRIVSLDKPANLALIARSSRWRRQMLVVDHLVCTGRLAEAWAAAEQVDRVHGYTDDRQEFLLVLEQIRRRQDPQFTLTEEEGLYLAVDDQLLRYGPRRAFQSLTAIRFKVFSVTNYSRYERMLEGMMLRRQQDLIEREERTLVR